MSSTDDRIVKMQFDNATFKQRALETKQSLTDLDRAVETTGKGKGLFNLSNGMQKVSVTASKMAVIATTALATITNKVVQSGLAMASSLTLDPLKQGFHEYESLLTKQNVIQNATGKSAKVVKGVLNDLNKYSDKTIYSFGNMTDAITKFVNAGVPLKQSVTSIKGIANAAAYSGASAEEANRAMYAFSQSMSLGFIQLQDWNQIENANMGTQQFKNTLLEAGVAAGTLTKKGKEYITQSGKSISATKGWRDGLHEQWATTEVLNTALGKYADTNTKLGKKAFKSAQDVRTFSAFMDTLKESLGSGWAKIFTTLIGGLDQATSMWTGLSNGIGGAVQATFNWLNHTLKVFKTLGGFGEIAQGFKNLWAPIAAIFTAVGDAWHAAFPDKGPGSGQVLFNIAHGFAQITAPLQTVATWIPKLVPFLTALFKTVKMGAGGLGELTHLIGNLARSLGDLFSVKAPSSGGFTSFFEKILSGLGNMFDAGVNIAKDILDGIIQGFSSGSIDNVGALVGTGLIGAIAFYVRKLAKGGIFKFDFGGGIADSIKGTFGQLTDTLSAMQTQLKVKTLMEIAIAVGVLSASMVALSFIKGDDLKKSLTAIGVGMAELVIGMAAMDKIGGATAFAKLPIMAAGLVLLSTAVLILTGAIAAMSALSWDQIGKGLTGVGGALVVIAAGMKLMPTTLPITGAGLVLVSVGLTAIAGAIAIMGNLEWETIGKGLVTTAGALLIIAGAMQLMPISMPVTAAGLVLVGIALNEIAGALAIMGANSWEGIAKGLVALGGSLLILGVGLSAMSASLVGSAALVVAATALAILVPPLMLLSTLSWEAIAKGLVALGGGLLILAGGLTLMSASIVGAAALLIVAPAILALATALVALSTLSWEDLAVALVALAGGLTVIGLAGLLLAPVIPALLGLGAALLLLGGGLALAGVGILAFSTGLAVLVGLGGAAVALLGKYIGAFIQSLGPLAEGFVTFLVALAKGIGQQAPVFIAAFLKMAGGMIDAFGKLLPKLGELLKKAISTAIAVVVDYIPRMATAGVKIIAGFLRGIASNIGGVIDAGADLIVAFIQGIGRAAARIANAAVTTVITFINAMAASIRTNMPLLMEAMRNVGKAMIQGLIAGIGDMFGDALNAIGNVVHGMIDKAKGIAKIFSPSRVFADIGKFMVLGLSGGIQSNAASAITAVASMVSGQIAVATQYVNQFIQTLDQQAIAARARADGLAVAAEKAAKLAKMTKGKGDDKAAKGISKRADAASKAADAAEAKAEARKAAQERVDQFRAASTIDKAKMRSEDAQNQLDAAKAAEARAAKEREAAAALDRQAKAKDVSAKERKKLQAEADRLRAQAKADAAAANASLNAARASAADALAYQKKAGDEAAAAFQAAFEADAKAAADEEAFNKLSDADKAVMRRKQAEDLQAKAAKDLNDAKALAYTDLEAANALAEQAMNEADQARQYLNDATQLETSAAQGTGAQSGGGALGTVVNLDATDAASIAMNDYSNLYDMASAAAARDKTIQFNQYNTSPEALSPTEVYRQTNNLITNAADKLSEAANAA
jgi:tape measure domain-containing protein